MARSLLALLTFFPLVILAQDSGWELRYDKDDIQVHHRKSNLSPINELKLVTVVNSSMPVLLQFLSDVDHFPIWVYGCVEARQVEQPTPAEGIYYSRMDFPWPLRDRDFYAHSKASVLDQGKKVLIEVEGRPDFRPEREKVVRIPHLSVNWTLTELTPNRIRIEYYLHTDPGGNLPKWMVNMALDKGPAETLQNIRTGLASFTPDVKTRGSKQLAAGQRK